jgi:5-methylcytosine-specific restriction endonuclease McrA
MIDSTRAVVLNSSYEPLSVISSRRALVLVLEGKATISEQHPSAVIRSPSRVFPIPTQIVLKEYVKSRSAFRVPAQLTQRNLFIRDDYTCQYCGRKKKDLAVGEFLTRDHLIPTVRGGKDVWLNVVAACNKCNNKKANYTVEEAGELFGMQLLSQPTVPTVFSIWAKADLKIPKHLKEML